MNARVSLLLVVSGLALAGKSVAQEPTFTTTTDVETPGLPEDSPHQATLDEAMTELRSGNTARAVELLNGIRTDCDTRVSSSEAKVLSFANLGEFMLYTTQAQGTGSISWVDFACPSTYQTLAYIHAAAREFDKALPLLETATNLAPYWAQPHVERGYILNQLRRFEEALASYEKALELSQRFESSRSVRPTALRGAGFALIELGDLDRARAMFNESLELEPGNQLALGELRYIDQLEASRDNEQ